MAACLMDLGAGLEGDFLGDRLVAAVEAGDLKQLQQLMQFAKNAADAVHWKDKDGRSLVHIAMQTKQTGRRTELLEMLVSIGADLKEVDFFGNDAISQSAALKDPDVRRLLDCAKNGEPVLKKQCSISSFD